MFTMMYLAYGFSAVASGVFMLCIGALLDHTASIGANQKRLLEALEGKKQIVVAQNTVQPATLAPAPQKPKPLFADR